MNDIQTIDSGSGLLKNSYQGSPSNEDSPLTAALNRKRLKLSNTKRRSPLNNQDDEATDDLTYG